MSIPRRAVAPLLALVVLASLLGGGWYASADPTLRRNWDKRYSLRNVHSILTTGSLRPAFPWYPSLSHLPQAALVASTRAIQRATGTEVFPLFQVDGSFASGTYLLSRWLNVLFGGGCLLLTFAAGCSHPRWDSWPPSFWRWRPGRSAPPPSTSRIPSSCC